VGIDVDIRAHNRAAIEQHPLFRRITMIEGSSTDADVIRQVQALTAGKETVMVCLDSNHTYEHVLQELRLYSPLVTPGSYLVVFDGIIEDLPADFITDRPWGRGNNPLTAIQQFLREQPDFVPDRAIESQLLITAAPMGYLRRTP
jgi:cephalosporin hydroxylase